MVSQSSLTSGYSPARLIFAFLSSMFFSLWANAQTQALTVPAQGTANVPFTVQWSGGRSYIYLEQRVGNGAWVRIGQYGASGSAQITRTEGTYSYRVNDCLVRGGPGGSGHDCTTFWPTIRTITIASAAPTGTLTTNSPCSLPGHEAPNRCMVTMNITKQNILIGCTWFLNPTQLIGCDGNSPVTGTTGWVTTTPRIIELRGHPDYPVNTEAGRLAGAFLDQKTVVAATPSGTLTTNSPCSLPGHEDPNRCMITMNITKQHILIGCTWFLNPTQLIGCDGNSPVTGTTGWITTTPRVIELRGHPDYPASTEAARLAGVFLDQKTAVAVRASSSSSAAVSSAQSSRISSASSASSAPSTQAGTTFFTYDELGRLKTVTHPNNVKNTYEYDAAGNRTKKELTN